MPWINSVPTLTAFVAFILSTLCLFAGTRRNILTGGHILTLYTPDIGNSADVPGLYSVYVMSYCAGYLSGSSPNVRTDITSCSHRSPLFFFDPAEALLEGTKHGATLNSLGFPSAVSDDFRAFSVSSQTMAIFYCIGAGFLGLAILTRLWYLLSGGRRVSATEVSCLLLSFTCFGISSIIATVYAFQFVDLINYHGKAANVSATYGTKFLGMTWAAVGLLLVGGITGLIFVLIDSTRPDLDRPLPAAELKKVASVGDTESARSSRSIV